MKSGIINEYVSTSSIMSNIIDELGLQEVYVDEKLILGWIEDELVRNEVPESLIDSIALVEVRNYKADLPEGARTICEVAYTQKPVKKDDCKVIGHRVVQWSQRVDEDCELEINIKCPRCKKADCSCHTEEVVVDVDRIWEMAHPEIYYSGYVAIGRFGYGVSNHDPRFKLAKIDTNPFSNVKFLPKCANLHCHECEQSVKVGDNVIETTFEKGQLLITYLKARTDEDGNRMVKISNRNHLLAITEWVKYKHFYIEYTKKREASSRALYQEAFQLNEEFAARAISEDIVPDAKEIMEFWAQNKFTKIANAYHRHLNPDKRNRRKYGSNVFGK